MWTAEQESTSSSPEQNQTLFDIANPETVRDMIKLFKSGNTYWRPEVNSNRKILSYVSDVLYTLENCKIQDWVTDKDREDIEQVCNVINNEYPDWVKKKSRYLGHCQIYKQKEQQKDILEKQRRDVLDHQRKEILRKKFQWNRPSISEIASMVPVIVYAAGATGKLPSVLGQSTMSPFMQVAAASCLGAGAYIGARTFDYAEQNFENRAVKSLFRGLKSAVPVAAFGTGVWLLAPDEFKKPVALGAASITSAVFLWNALHGTRRQ